MAAKKRPNKSPSRTRYNAEKRWEANKARKQARHQKRLEKKARHMAKRAERGLD